MTLEELNKEIKSGAIRRVYFFYGEEWYLLKRRVAAIEKKLVKPEFKDFNRFYFEGKKTSLESVLEAVEQFPQMSDRKLVIVKNSGFFNQSAGADYKRLKTVLPELPDYTCLVFIEEKFEKDKEKNLKILDGIGGVVRFDLLPVNRVELWLEDYFRKREKVISPRDLSYMVRICGLSLGKLCGECEKLLNYLGDREKITREDIDAVVDQAAEYRIFDLLDNIIAGHAAKAREQLKYLKERKPEDRRYAVTATGVLARVIEKYSELLLCKQLKECGLPAGDIAAYFDRRAPLFAVSKTIEESRRYDEEYLKRMIRKGLEYDLDIKNGRIEGWTAAELYLTELLMRRA